MLKMVLYSENGLSLQVERTWIVLYFIVPKLFTDSDFLLHYHDQPK